MSKIRVGWFTFTCCEDSTIIFTELLNKHYKEWFEGLEFVHARILQKDDAKEIQQMDVAFVEGAISSDTQEAKLKKIRKSLQRLWQLGRARSPELPQINGISLMRCKKKEIRDVLDKFKYKEKVMKLSEVVKVDVTVPGCPMNEQIFLEVMDKVLHARQ